MTESESVCFVFEKSSFLTVVLVQVRSRLVLATMYSLRFLVMHVDLKVSSSGEF